MRSEKNFSLFGTTFYARARARALAQHNKSSPPSFRRNGFANGRKKVPVLFSPVKFLSPRLSCCVPTLTQIVGDAVGEQVLPVCASRNCY